MGHGAPLTSVPSATDCPPAGSGTDAVTTRTPAGGGQPGEPSYTWRNSSCWMVTSERPRVATPRKNRAKYLPSRSGIVSQGLTARLAHPASVTITASELAIRRPVDPRTRIRSRSFSSRCPGRQRLGTCLTWWSYRSWILAHVHNVRVEHHISSGGASPGAPGFRYRHDFEQMAVGVLEVETAAAAPVIETAIGVVIRLTSVG